MGPNVPYGSCSKPVPLPSAQDRAACQAAAWGGGNLAEAKKELLAAQQALTGEKSLPWASFPALTAPACSGERYEHLQACMAIKEFGPRKRLKRALDRLTVAWAAGLLPPSARWLMNTSLLWLSKEKGGLTASGKVDREVVAFCLGIYYVGKYDCNILK